MIAIIRKELRENAKWAMLGALLMSAAILYYLRKVHSAPFYSYNYFELTINSILSAATQLAAPLVALALGALQTWPETRRDHWMFLVHRPVPRSAIFTGKAIAGLTLYFLATVIPVAAAVWCVAHPGNVAEPFYPGMALPAIADLLCGTAYYFAGMIVGLRPARWLGSRLLPIGMAIVCSMMIAWIPYFWLALIVIAAGAGTLAVAAHASFCAGGHYSTIRAVGRAASGITLALGIAAAAGFVITVASAFTRENFLMTQRSYVLLRDGTIAIQTYSYMNQGDITDLDGRRIERFYPSGTFNANKLAREAAGQQKLTAETRTHWYYQSYRQMYRHFVRLNINSARQISWLYDKHTNVVRGYDAMTRQPIGAFGVNGFFPRSADAEPFPATSFGHSEMSATFCSPQAAWRIDTEARTIDTFKADPSETIFGASELSRDLTGSILGPLRVAVATRQNVYLFTRESEEKDWGRQTFAYDLPPERSVNIAVASPNDAESAFVMLNAAPPLANPDDWRTADDRITWFTADGRRGGDIIRPSILRDQHEQFAKMRRTPIWPMIAMPPIAVAAGAVLGLITGQLSTAFDSSWVGYTVVVAAGTATAIAIVIFWARQYALSRRRTILWAILAGLLGLGGILLMWSLIDWPARIRCPSCRRRRIVTRDTCESCAAPFHLPPRDGTEILAA